ncbi:hypothetical protein B0H14DRAFT_3545368 [Mycena olivaceomarginata]|nr:hypothetical protein B0H14DRAFT_3545368 [Mycena olivaceomarginata]
MLGRGTDPQTLNNYISGGVGGPGGEGHEQGTGGHGGSGQGPTVHFHYDIRTEHFTLWYKHLKLPTIVLLHQESFMADGISLTRCIIFSCLTEGQNIYVLHGLGGAGKTEIVLKFINELSSRFSDIFFIDTSTIATIDTGLKNIAVAKNSGNSQQDGLLWLTSKVEEWLLVFDNADDPKISLNDFIPQCNHGNIIITSRNPGLCVYAGSHSLVSDMEAEDAVALLLKSAAQEATIVTEQVAIEIVKALHYLPLAIVQAGAFISKSQDLNGYLALYTNNQAQLLSEKPVQSHDRYARTVYTTWQMSFDQLKPLAAMLLQHCSFLHCNGISEKIFSYASKYRFQSSGPSKGELQAPLEFLSHFLGPTGEWDSLQFFHVINEILAYSLISFDAEKKLFSIHPLVHAWSRATVRNPERYMSTMGSILGMAISEHPERDIQLASLVLCPHVELAVQMNAEVAPVFSYQYALIFREGGKYKQTEKLLEEVLKKQKQLLGYDHPDTLLTMGHLARTYLDLGELQKAKELSVIVLEKQKQLLGDYHPHTLSTMGNLANTYSKLGEDAKAEELKVMVLVKQKHLLGDNHPHTLRTMGNLAETYSHIGEYQKAEELQVIVLEKQKQLLGDYHPDILHAMGHLANTYSNLGEDRKAEELEVIVLEKRKQVLGDNHPDTLRAMSSLASTYADLGEDQKAKELGVVVLQKQKQLLGDNHPGTLITMGDLANTYSNLGEDQKAEELKVIVLEKRKQVLGAYHPDTLRSMGSLASTYSHLGENQKAKELKLIVLENQKQVLGDYHPDTLRSMGSLASTYSHLGEDQKARGLHVIVLEKQKQLLGDNHPDTLNVMGSLARTYFKLGESQKAKELHIIVLEKQKQVLGDNHPDTLQTKNNLAMIYSVLGEHQKAEELQVAVLEKR